MKKIISVIAVCAMLTGCSAKSEYSEEVSAVKNSVTSTTSTTSTASESSAESKTPSTASTSSSAEEKKPVSSTAVSSNGTTSEKETSTAPEESAPAKSTVTSTTSAPSVPVEEKSSWNEEKVDATTLYVNTKGIYSRKNAVIGSEAVKLYGLNDKVTIVAVTDTDYYKLEDGSFIHKDYLSDKETVPPKPSETEKPVTPSKPNVSGAISADAERLLNSVSLNPMKTNESDLDVLVEDVLSQTTNSSMSTSQKVTAVYDYIVKTCSYGRPAKAYGTDLNYHSDFDGLTVSHAYTLLANKRGVCDDYSSLFVVLTRAIGLESYVVSGQVGSKSGGTTGHVWTIVKINGEYYVFDPQIEQSNTVNGQIAHTFFCRPESSVSSMYTYGVSDAMSLCLMFSDDEIKTDNARDLAIALFGNFVVDEGEKSHKIGIAYY